MAQFNYEQYAAQQAARKAASTSGDSKNTNSRPEVRFFGEFMKNDGDVVVVRLPYKSMDDVMFETTHLVDYPGRKFKARVSCGGNDCMFCQQGVKVDTRCLVKGLIYEADDSGKMNRYNGIWDRPSAFADIEIKGLIKEYGDLSQALFKIRRTGSGTGTRYTISIVLPNNSIYNDTTCPADFSELDKIDPAKILCKTIAQYEAALNPNAANQSTATPEAAPVANPVDQIRSTPAYTNTQPVEAATERVVEPSPAAAPTSAADTSRQTRRYVF